MSNEYVDMVIAQNRELEARCTAISILVDDALSLILGWCWVFNELAGHCRYDYETPAGEAFTGLYERAIELGCCEGVSCEGDD